MDINIIFGGSLVAAFIAGFIALLAPCCISVMLPSYLSGSVHNKRALVGHTLLFGLGVATIILPIILGSSYLVGLINTQHMIIYLIGGGIMVAMSIFVLLGGELHIPIAHKAKRKEKTGPFGIYSLGVFSGVTSSCCAPVLIGLIALSTFTNSFIVVLLLGISYVLGMVLPLLIITALFRKYGSNKLKILKVRSIKYRIGPLKRTISSTALFSGILLLIVGGFAIYLGFTEDTMAQPTGWQYQVAITMQRLGATLTNWLSFIPNWVFGAFVLIIVILGIKKTVSTMSAGDDVYEEK